MYRQFGDTTLVPGAQTFYPVVATYIVRQQDILPDGRLRAELYYSGLSHQNIINEPVSEIKWVNTVVKNPCIDVSANCVGGVGESAPITCSGTVRNCGDIALIDVTVSNSVNGTVKSIGSLAVGETKSLTDAWVPLNPCTSTTAIFTAQGWDELNGNSKRVTDTASTTCVNTLTPGIDVTQNCSGSPVVPGGTQGFSGTVRNTGNVTLTSVVVVNTLGGTVLPAMTLAPNQERSFSGSYAVPTNSCSTTSTSTATGRSICGVQVTDTASSTCLTLIPAPLCDIDLYPGLTVYGCVGATYGIQYTTNLNQNTNWVGVTNVTLTAPSYLWHDSQPATLPQRIYRAVVGPTSIP